MVSTADKCLISAQDAAQRLGLGDLGDPARAIHDAARRGLLRAVRVGIWTLIDPDSVAQYVPLTEVARRLGILNLARDPDRVVRELISAGELDGIQLSARLFVRRESLERKLSGEPLPRRRR